MYVALSEEAVYILDINVMTCNKVVGRRINLLPVVEVQVLRGLEYGPTPEARWSTILQHNVVGLGHHYTNQAFSNASCMLITSWGQFDLISHEA